MSASTGIDHQTSQRLTWNLYLHSKKCCKKHHQLTSMLGWGTALWMEEFLLSSSYELLSKLLVSPFITPIVVPYIIPYRTPFKEFRLWLIYLSWPGPENQIGLSRSSGQGVGFRVTDSILSYIPLLALYRTYVTLYYATIIPFSLQTAQV